MTHTLGHSRAFIAAAAIVLVIVTLGCSGRPRNVAKKVTGKVTLGGQPLEGALIMFTPSNGGSPSSGRTDASGSYSLIWAQQRGRQIEGAQVGEHTVRISTYQEGDPDASPPRPEVAEKVPIKYRQEGGFPTATVNKGTNNIDFALEAGPVEAPAAKGKGKAGAKKGPSSGCY